MWDRSRFAISHQYVVTTIKIVHCGIDFKSTPQDQVWQDPAKWEPVFGKDHAQNKDRRI
jgi:hypothetical protein